MSINGNQFSDPRTKIVASLKRSPLTRRTPLARSTVRLKRTEMKQVSDKKKKADRIAKPLKDAWMEPFTFCWWCGSKYGLHIHHIAKRSNGGEYDQPCNWFCSCPTCNTGPLDKSDKPTIIKALLLKLKWDKPNFRFDLWHKIKSKGVNRPSHEEFWNAADKAGLSERFDVGTFIH